MTITCKELAQLVADFGDRPVVSVRVADERGTPETSQDYISPRGENGFIWFEFADGEKKRIDCIADCSSS